MRLWFYVPDYPLVWKKLSQLYAEGGVEEWTAEPGRVAGFPDDADVTVEGDEVAIARFKTLLERSQIKGLRIEGKRIG